VLKAPLYSVAVILSSFLALLFLAAPSPNPVSTAQLERELSELTRRGLTYRFLDNTTIEIKEEWSGFTRIKTLKEPSEAEIRAWAAARGIPILEIDPAMVDTSQYTGWYTYWTGVPVSSDAGEGRPMVAGDADRNGIPEVYGKYWDSGGSPSIRVYEVDTMTGGNLRYNYSPVFREPTALLDVDRDSLIEICLFAGDSSVYYGQSSPTTLPTSFRFGHRHIEQVSPGYTHVVFADLDRDSLVDFLYKGSTESAARVFVAEYRPVASNFLRVWSTDFGRGSVFVSDVGGFGVGDFDNDGRMEFAVSHLEGRVLVTENVADDRYEVVWTDSLPFVNAHYAGGGGDIDNDGVPEFFVGATMSTRDWFTVLEADSDNSYSSRLLIHLLSGGPFDNPQFLTTDVDGDGRTELVICAGRDIYIFNSNSDNNYYLWYLKRENARDGIQFYDFNHDGRKDMIVGKTVYIDPPGYFRSYSDIYIASGLVGVKEPLAAQPQSLVLYPNYPNPFNPSTTIRFSLSSRMLVSLKIYDILGKEVQSLVDGIMDSGIHTVEWRPDSKTSGVYFCRLQAETGSITSKLLLIH
jgi:hypothetical protein